MEDWRPMKEAAETLGIHRNTLWRWATAKRIKTKSRPVEGSNLLQRLVDIESLKGLVGDGLKPGRRPASK
jgi:predicted DNA-binding protein (UPF0251 family)